MKKGWFTLPRVIFLLVGLISNFALIGGTITAIKILVIVVDIAAYLNIGWLLGMYKFWNVKLPAQWTFAEEPKLAKFMAGPKHLFMLHQYADYRWTYTRYELAWPIFILTILSAWLIWFIFAGGMFRKEWE